MTTVIPHRELRNNSSEILRRVAAGEVFRVTNHGVVVAEIRTPQESAPLANLSYRAARTRGGFDEIRRSISEVSSAEIMDYLKGDK